MKSPKHVINQRRDKLFQILLNNHEVTTRELAKVLDVSELTIRRDLDYFERKNLIERFYGGARILTYKNAMTLDKDIQHIKNCLAKKAAEFIDNGDTVFINTSSTALLVLNYLNDKEVTIITNNGRAMLGQYNPNITLILTGGELSAPKDSLTGDFAIQMLSNVRANKAIFGCSGFSKEGGMTTSVLREVSINQTMIRNCRATKIVLSDYTKIGVSASYSTGGVNDFDVLITDGFANEELIQDLQDNTPLTIVQVPISPSNE